MAGRTRLSRSAPVLGRSDLAYLQAVEYFPIALQRLLLRAPGRPHSAMRKFHFVEFGLNAVDKTGVLNHSVIVPSETFKASRLTRGNFLFPTIIEVTDRSVIRHKRSWVSKDEISINIAKVASVHIRTGIFWADILIESSGGSDPLITAAIARRMRAVSASWSKLRREVPAARKS